MFLISWNVAGWSATSVAIRESYGSLENFFHLTGADIICIQECKGTWSKLETSPVEMGAADPPLNKRPKVSPLVVRDGEPPIDLNSLTVPRQLSSPSSSHGGVPGWESFWSLSGKVHRGFNGVVTFVKKGLTLACENRPFEEDAFNDEGRTVVTYHSQFTLVNVYVPNARGGTRSDFKRSFLSALRCSVLPRLRREGGKPVVLVGDLNCTYRAEDAHWTFRRLHLPRLLQIHSQAQAGLSEEAWLMRFPHVTKDAVERVTNLAVNTVCASFLPDDDDDKGGNLSPPVALDVTHGSGSTGSSAVEAILTLRQALQDAGMTRRQLLYNTGTPPTSLASLIDMGILTVHASDMSKAFPPMHNEELFRVVQHVALAPHGDESVEFLGRLLQVPVVMSVTPDFEARELLLPTPSEDAAMTTRMWDTFLLTEPSEERGETDELTRAGTVPYCPCPFTVWDQSKNKRLSNEGSRIDFILVDDALKALVVSRGNTENNVGLRRKAGDQRCPTAEDRSTHDFFSELRGASLEDGIYRAMAGGAYQGASYDKTGIPPLADFARGVLFRGLPSTGLFITPPQFSDHTGVCVRFKARDLSGAPFALTPRTGKLVEKTGKCMYRPPVGLASFFQKKVSTESLDVPKSPCLSTPGAPALCVDSPPRKAARTCEPSTATYSKNNTNVVEISSGDD